MAVSHAVHWETLNKSNIVALCGKHSIDLMFNKCTNERKNTYDLPKGYSQPRYIYLKG